MDSEPHLAGTRDRLTGVRRRLRRAVLRHRRLLAALLTAVAVAAGLHTVAAPPPSTVTVSVAARDLPAGAVLRADDLVAADFAPGSVPDDLAGDAVGRTLAAPLRRGEPVTVVRLVGPLLTDGSPGLVATPVRLPDGGMVALLEVGDRVDLLAADPRAGDAEVVASGLPVLAIPDETEAEGVTASGLPGRLVVVGAAADEVPRIAAAAVRTFVTFTWSGG